MILSFICYAMIFSAVKSEIKSDNPIDLSFILNHGVETIRGCPPWPMLDGHNPLPMIYPLSKGKYNITISFEITADNYNWNHPLFCTRQNQSE